MAKAYTLHPGTECAIIRTLPGIFFIPQREARPSPIVGPSYDRIRLQQLANENIRAMVCDFDQRAGARPLSIRESTLYAGLKKP